MNTATQTVSPRMPSLQKLEKTLKKLDLSWKVIETTARVVSPPHAAGHIATLEHTRQAFSQLAAEMVEQIARTHLENRQHDLAARAQVAIDILVRNLFERTADVGFIATDAPLVSFVMAPQDSAAGALQDRLQAYRAKYTVYDDILVLDAQAQVLLGLQPRAPGPTPEPGWWGQACAASVYVEHYGSSPLFPGQGPVLLYAHRILAPDGRLAGAVVLKFDLASELASIFAALGGQDTVLLLLDAQARVLASSQGNRLARHEQPALGPAGAVDTPVTLRHQSVDYLYAHCATRGYQGYGGPGWTAAALQSLEQAFDTLQQTAAEATDGALNDAANDELALDHPQLHRIVARARAIEEDLNRVIWNGKLTETATGNGSALGPLFAEIGRTSKQTIAVFDDAIAELKALLLAGRRAELAAHASLAADIMDRNLYERANDCRWWALSLELCERMQTLQDADASSAAASEAATRAAEILAHLNSLYTVYRRVALFDRHGRILAVSRDAASLPEDARIPAELVQRTLALRGDQAYAVSSMQPHALADGAPTYLFCAPLRKPGGQDSLGGIALAFNCADELATMLKDSLPPASQALGVYLDSQGQVLASTDPGLAVGESPAFLAGLLAAQQPAARCDWQGQSYLVGRARSQGYREFKVSDGYREDVHTLLLSPVQRSEPVQAALQLPQPAGDGVAGTGHFGVVQCGRLRFGLAGAHVVEAVEPRLAAAPVASEAVGLMQYGLDGENLVLPVYDACRLTGQYAMVRPQDGVAIVLRRRGEFMVLLVDRLIDVIACDPVAEPPGGLNPDAPWINGYIHDGLASTEPIFTIDPNGLHLR